MKYNIIEKVQKAAMNPTPQAVAGLVRRLKNRPEEVLLLKKEYSHLRRTEEQVIDRLLQKLGE